MNRIVTSFSALLATGMLLGISSAQQPPPPPPDPNGPPPPANGPPPRGPAAVAGQNSYARKGTIKAFNTGPNGETNGVILRDGTTVMFPPESGRQLRSLVKEGSQVRVSGTTRPGGSGQIVDAQSITANGQTITVPVSTPPPPAGAPPAPAPTTR